MYQQPMVNVALKRDRNVTRTITKVSYELNKKAYILLEGQVQEVKKSEEKKVADASFSNVVEQAIEEQKNKGGRPRKQPVV